jgi:predicted  nucleic acid-binding Zn-ribbon protein
MDIDRHDELEELRTRVAELEALVQQLGQQLDSLSEHLEYRFQRHYERIEAADDDARRRDRDLEYDLDRVRSDLSVVERAVEQTTRGW